MIHRAFCATRRPDASTACHARLDKPVGHSNPSSAGSGTLGEIGTQPDGGEGRLDGYPGSFLNHLVELGVRVVDGVVDVLPDAVGDGFSAVDYRLRGGAARRAASSPDASAPLKAVLKAVNGTAIRNLGLLDKRERSEVLQTLTYLRDHGVRAAPQGGDRRGALFVAGEQSSLALDGGLTIPRP